MTGDLAETERWLRQAQHLLHHGRPRDGAEEWGLLASIIGEADLAIRQARRGDPSLVFPLLDEVVAEFYEMTAGFTDPEFLRSTRAARRRNRALFG